MGVALTIAAARAEAQAPGLPVMGADPARGGTVGAMYGFPDDDASGGSAFGVSFGYGGRRFAVTGFVSNRAEPAIPSFLSAGASVSYKLVGGPLVPFAVNLQAGAAHSTRPQVPGDDIVERLSVWHVPLGLGISWTFARPLVAIKPWVAPRLDVTRASRELIDAQTSTDFGVSAGINFGLLNGLGLQIAYDRVWADGIHPSSLGVGLSFTFK